MQRLRAFPRRLSPDARAVILIVLIALLGNALYLLDASDPNPLGPDSNQVIARVPGWTRGQPTIDTNVGVTAQALGHLAIREVVHGHIPWWNPYEGTGAPLAGEMQSAAFFPGTLFQLLSNGQLYERILLELVAGISTYLVLRRLELSWWASVAGGVAFTLNGTMAWLQNAVFNPVAFLPLMLLGIEQARAASAHERPGAWRLLALAGTLSFVAGFPEVAYIDAVLAAVWAACRCGGLERTRRSAFARKLAGGAIVGALLSGPLLIASADYLAHADLAAHNGTLFASAHLSAHAIPQLVIPYIYGGIFEFNDAAMLLTRQWGGVGGYLTAVLLLLAAVGLLSPRLQGLRMALFGWIVLVFARMFGVPLLRHVLGWLPWMSHVAFYRYAAASMEMAVIVLAALGVDELVRRRRPIWTAALGAAAAGPVLGAYVGSGALRRQLGPGFASSGWALDSLGWSLLTVAAVTVAAALARSARLRGALLLSVVSLDMVAMFVLPELAAPRSQVIDQAAADYLGRHLGTYRFVTISGPLQPNYGSYYGLAELNVNDTPIPDNLSAYIHHELDPAAVPTIFTGATGGVPDTSTSPRDELLAHLSSYQRAGVAYVLTPPGVMLPQTPATFTLVATNVTGSIWHLAGAAPLFGSAHGQCRDSEVTWTSVAVDCSSATSTFVYRQTAMAGWSATVDGHPVRIIRNVEGPFQSIAVPAGRHTVVFDYQPPHILLGYLALLSGVVLFALPARLGRRLSVAARK